MKLSELALGCATLASIAAPLSAHATRNIDLVYNGLAVANVAPTPTIPAFADWCATGTQGCGPTVQQPVFDLETGKQRGMVYVWATFPFLGGSVIPSSFCFSEFFVFTLENNASIYAHSGVNGTCGATMDPVLKPPMYTAEGAQTVIAGGGDGVIVGGTGRFRNLGGTFTDRVFVGFGAPTSGVGGIVYYDQLIFSLSPN